MRHSEERLFPFGRHDLFSLVLDVGAYPAFLPWCLGARLKDVFDPYAPGDQGTFRAELLIGFRLFKEKYTSRVTYETPHIIHVTLDEGPFKTLQTHWWFDHSDAGTLVRYDMEVVFQSSVMQKTLGLFFDEAARKMLLAFEGRAYDTLCPKRGAF